MAALTFRPFTSGMRLTSGDKLNALFQTGREAIQTLRLGSQGAQSDAVQKVALAVTAITNTDLTATIPATAIIQTMTVYTTTAFTAVTDAMISIGNAAGGAQYVAAVSIKALGVYQLTLVNSAAAALVNFPAATPNAQTSPNLYIRIAQSGGNTAVGNATLMIAYVLP